MNIPLYVDQAVGIILGLSSDHLPPLLSDVCLFAYLGLILLISVDYFRWKESLHVEMGFTEDTALLKEYSIGQNHLRHLIFLKVSEKGLVLILLCVRW